MQKPSILANLKHEPISYSDLRYNADGFCTIYKNSEVLSYCQVFRNGITETLDVRLMSYTKDREGATLPWNSTEKYLVKNIVKRTRFLTNLGIPKPWYIFISFLDAKGYITNLATHNIYQWEEMKPIDKDIVNATECVWNEDEQNLFEVLRPALDSLANAFGLSKSPNYDKAGKYNFENYLATIRIIWETTVNSVNYCNFNLYVTNA